MYAMDVLNFTMHMSSMTARLCTQKACMNVHLGTLTINPMFCYMLYTRKPTYGLLARWSTSLIAASVYNDTCTLCAIT